MPLHCVYGFLISECRTIWAYSDPFYIWPLSPSHSTVEIAGHPSVGTASCISSAIGHPALDYNGLELRGSTNSFAEFTLDTTASIEDFSIMLFVVPEGFSGTLFHYEKQNLATGTNEMRNIILSYENMTSHLIATGNNASDILISISLVTNFQPDGWMPITISYDFSGRGLAMYAGDAKTTEDTDEHILLGLPGKIRIGGVSKFGYDSYLGRVTCLQFYDAKTNNGDFDDALIRCTSASWPPDMGPPSVSSYPSCNAMRGYFQLTSRGRTPPPSTVPIASLNTTSKVKCADWCLLPNNACVSFVIDKVHKVCSLYDVDDTAHLIISGSGTDYYVSSTLVNCC
ncbi:uncharacterized protein LOC123538077 [Mercenaria mercenaria]|uniref:uncharacterized protein LOC123538077 n=1 Tax=Mercenaria mercenaria TaxID=6596 RepID=UPI00234F8624|nr:uncharacterized protein LOC123538077 [Mercenaria mercenaria]